MHHLYDIPRTVLVDAHVGDGVAAHERRGEQRRVCGHGKAQMRIVVYELDGLKTLGLERLDHAGDDGSVAADWHVCLKRGVRALALGRDVHGPIHIAPHAVHAPAARGEHVVLNDGLGRREVASAQGGGDGGGRGGEGWGGG